MPVVATLDDFCAPYKFWSPPAVSGTVDFTPCFEDTAIVWGVCAFLWVFGALRFVVTNVTGSGSFIVVSKLHKVKLISALLVIASSAVQIGHTIYRYESNEQVFKFFYISGPLVCITVVFVMVLTEWDRRRGVRSSGLMLFFWFFLTIYGIISVRTWSQMYVDHDKLQPDLPKVDAWELHFGARCAMLLFSAVALAAAAIPDSRPLYSVDSDVNPCPEVQASFLSQISFWWLNDLVRLGYKRALQTADLWALNPQDRSSFLGPKFEHYWEQQCKGPDGADSGIAGRSRSAKGRVNETSPLLSGSHASGGGTFSSPDASESESAALLPKNEPKVELASGHDPSLVVALAKSFGGPFIRGAMYKLVQDLLAFVSPLVLKLLIGFIENRDEPAWKGYFYAGLMVATALIQSVFLHQYFHVCFTVGMRLRSAVINAVYKKSLRLANSARKQSTQGEIVNLMSVDAQRFMDICTYLNMLWSAPLQIILSMYFLWDTMGPSVLAGLGVMILLIPINMTIAIKTRRLQVRQMKAKDSRIKMMNEVLNGIKVIKLYAWERSFLDLVSDIRNGELKVLKSTAYLNSVSSFTWMMAPFLVALATFASYILAGNNLDPTKAFVALALFNILRFPLNMLPFLISNLVEASVSTKRLKKFLKLEELDTKAVERSEQLPPPRQDCISMRGASFQWSAEDPVVLRNINLSLKSPSLIAVVGQVGAGKSSLISALLGEMEKVSGSVSVKGRVSYVPQQAWIQNATVRQNITFGQRYNPSYYNKVINACALGPDLEILQGGDMAEIGEKGINLSGGQKQRVSLARAVYSDADITLLDDPLSAVDSHVGKHIFENVIGPNGLLKDKTRVLVTHQVAILSQVDSIVVLQGGNVSESGSYSELMRNNGAFAEFLRTYANAEEASESDEEAVDAGLPIRSVMEEEVEATDDATALAYMSPSEDAAGIASRSARKSELERQRSEVLSGDETFSPVGSPPSIIGSPQKSVGSPEKQAARSASRSRSRGRLEHQKSSMRTTQDRDKDKKNKEQASLIDVEKSETGSVQGKVFISYARSTGYATAVFILVLYMMNNGFSIGTNIWLAEWSAQNTTEVFDNATNKSKTDVNNSLYLGVYGGLGLAQGLSVLAGSLAMAFGTIHAGKVLHKEILSNILRSPMSFFDTTPLGRIVNRFSKDIYTIDEVIPRSLRSFLMTFFNVISIMIVISISTPIFLAVILPLGVIYFFAQRYYVATSRQLKRLESVSRSPIFSHFSETLSGVSSIRAYSCQSRFIGESEDKVDFNQQAYYPSISSNRWLALRLEFVGNSIVFFAALFAVLEREYSFLNRDATSAASLAGLSVSYALTITQTLNWMVRMTSELETNIVSVERVNEYSQTPTEAALIKPDYRPAGDWPQQGCVSFNNYSTRYRPGLDLVIRGISCNVLGGEKVGIVGRTGAGKSSLTLALFRIIESAEGNIVIDGMDIGRMGLEDLRSKLTIIPQDPVLFSGKLRFNLDPFEQHTDADLWHALEHAHLRSFVDGVDDKLDFTVSEGGENLSVGQRQLVCLARALLRKTKILVLDEATAAVDLETDDLIQRTIRTEFHDCTVLTIAHRLNTIMD
eukprot:scpid33667/ scgid33028/ Multidrug resistance-associated protein 1; ATP-binding cassette sub-family C member 1; Leukotriene C(4) transporter